MQININQISFRSNFKFDYSPKVESGFSKLFRRWGENSFHIVCESDDPAKLAKGVNEEVYMYVDDFYDKRIESLLIQKGIEFKKTSTADVLDKENILSRISLSELDKKDDMYMPMVDVEKFDKLFAQSWGYIGPNGKNGIPKRYSGFQKYLLLNRPINAPSIHIKEINGRVEVGFRDGRHRYSVLRDMGFSEIPLAMRTKSFILAEKYGLLK